MHLASHTRPDTWITVRQASKFSNDPKACHDIDVKRIVKYLLGTSEEGLTRELDSTKGMEACTDADFAGGFDNKNAEDPESVYSRTGHATKCDG